MDADKWGPLGSAFAALCCPGVAPVIGALSAVLAGTGLALLIGASMWNWRLVRGGRTRDPETVEA